MRAFTWCGWSPGIGQDATTGEVTDDSVAHAHGTGRAAPPGSATAPGTDWVLTSLDVTDLDVLAPGSPDPCPAELDARADEAHRAAPREDR